MSAAVGETDLIRIVLADANVLYSRVLRDYLLYAADQEIIAITWSAAILDETTEHLMLNVNGFDRAAARRLVTAMNRAFPLAEVEPPRRTSGRWPMCGCQTTTIATSSPQPSPLPQLSSAPGTSRTSRPTPPPRPASRCSLPTSCSAGSLPSTSRTCLPRTGRRSRH